MVLAARASGRNGRTLLLVVAIIVLGAILTLTTSPVLQRANDAAPGAIEGKLDDLHATVRDLKAATPAGDGRAHVIEGKLDDLHATVRDLKAALEASSEAGAPSRREHVQRRDDYVQAKAVAKADFETDFQCQQNQGAAETCQIRCAGGCANAVQLCNSLPHCIKVSYNAKRTWATLKRKPTADEIRRHETRKEILNNDKLDLAKTVAREGWESSEVRVTANQATRGALASCPGFYNGNCNERGENLLGRCFCIAGYTGARCEVATAKPPCTNKDDRCFYAEDAGIFVISPSRWRKAQWAEGQLWTQNWNVNARTGDRVDDHMRDFNFYRDVGAPGTNLGNFIEVGAGPWTQSLWMIQQRKFQVENYVIMEPGASSYMNTVETCVYRDGEVRGFEGRTLIINAGAERLDVFDQAFDTLMMINVIEHVENGIRILRNIYNALKPGGLLIFNECAFRVRNFEIPTVSPHAIDATCPKECIIARPKTRSSMSTQSLVGQRRSPWQKKEPVRPRRSLSSRAHETGRVRPVPLGI